MQRTTKKNNGFIFHLGIVQVCNDSDQFQKKKKEIAVVANALQTTQILIISLCCCAYA